MGFIQGANRQQHILFNFLDEVVAQNHMVRLIDLLVDEIVQSEEDFYIDRGKSTEGRPAYHPSVFLKLYLYGYLNGISSSRKLERECNRNLELMWLLGRLAPDFKTIADYRRDQREQLDSIFHRYNLFLKDNKLIGGKRISIDGSKVRAYASQSVKIEKLKEAHAEAHEKLVAYIHQLDQADQDESSSGPVNKDSLNDPGEIAQYPGQEGALLQKIEKTFEELAVLEEHLEKSKQTDKKKLCLTDPDARLMYGRAGTHWSYNIQSCIDDEYKLIADIEATQANNDRKELGPALKRLKTYLGIIPEEYLADVGYGNMEEILKIEKEGIECFIPFLHNIQYLRDQRDGNTFEYDPEKDQYKCAEGEILSLVRKNKRDYQRGTIADVYKANDCRECPRKGSCAPKAKIARRVERHHNQEQREQYQTKMDSHKGKQMRVQRMSLSEHPFGTLKTWMGKVPLLLRGIDKINTEIKIYATAYNLLRSANLQSVIGLMELIKDYDWQANADAWGEKVNQGLSDQIQKTWPPRRFWLFSGFHTACLFSGN